MLDTREFNCPLDVGGIKVAIYSYSVKMKWVLRACLDRPERERESSKRKFRQIDRDLNRALVLNKMSNESCGSNVGVRVGEPRL